MPPTLKRFAVAALAAGLVAGGPGLAQIEPPTPVEQAALAKDAFSTGVLTRADGALDADLWRGARAERLRELLAHAPARPAGPALGEVLRRVLLSPGTAPDGAGPALGGAKLLALARAGYAEEARTVASLSDAPRNHPRIAEALATADLLAGETGVACRRNAGLSTGREDRFWVTLRVLCYAAAGERDAADLTLTLLREQSGFDETDDILLGAVASGIAPQTTPAPVTALHLAALRQLDLAPPAEKLDRAEAGVVRAIAEDAAADGATRVAAAMRAAAMGALPAPALKAVFDQVDVDGDALGRASALAASQPGDPMTDVIVYRSVQQMAAPEFLRDKAGRIAEALSIADSFPRAYAASLLYADDIRALEGALVPAREASSFALARMMAGDGGGAARWLFAMMGAGGPTTLGEELAMELIELTNLLATLDPVSAGGVAEAANISLNGPAFVAPSDGEAADGDAMAGIIEAAFEAASGDIRGQAALAALAASNVASPGDPVAAVVIAQSLREAGLDSLRRRMMFEAALSARYSTAEAASTEEAATPGAGETRQAAEQTGLMPRLKPPVGG